MARTLFSVEFPDPVERPVCEKCGDEMWITRVTPIGAGKFKHVFECPVCQITKDVIEDTSTVGSGK